MPSRRVVRAGHQAPTCRWGAGGSRKGAVGTTSALIIKNWVAENRRGARGDLAIGRCPGGTKGSLTPREDRRTGRARRAPTPPTPRFREPPAASWQPKTRVFPRWTFFARPVGPWSARFRPRSTDEGSDGHARPFATRPRDVRPLPAGTVPDLTRVPREPRPTALAHLPCVPRNRPVDRGYLGP